jgi:PKD repeat protein
MRRSFLRIVRSSTPTAGFIAVLSVAVLLLVVAPPGGRSGPSGPVAGAPAPELRAAGTAVAPIARGASPELPAPAPEWINVTNASLAPPSVNLGSLAYDPLASEYVYLGECAPAVCPYSLTWVFSGGRWANVTDPARAPPARTGAMLDFDANAGGVLLFGGWNGTALYNDTWLFRGGEWTNLSYLGPSPPALIDGSMAFDPAPGTNGSVLFGGCGASGCVNSTWLYRWGAGWNPVPTPTAAPSLREGQTMVYDASVSALVLFGGYGVGSCGLCDLGDTWEFYGGNWWTVAPTTAPPGREYAMMTYDPEIGGTLLTGGWNGTLGVLLNDTWEFVGGEWVASLAGPAPPALEEASAAPDSGAVAPLLFGGTASVSSDTGSWTFEVPPVASLSTSNATGETNSAATFRVGVQGGSGPYSVSLTYGDGERGYASGPGPTLTASHAYARSGTFTVNATLVDWMGATTSTSFVVHIGEGPAVRVSGPAGGDVGLPLAFSGSVLANGSGALSLRWDFGDGNQSTGASVSHAYATVGTYAVTLRATDSDGAVATSALSVVIAPPPTIVFYGFPTPPAAGSIVNLAVQVSGGTGPFQYSWSLGDGSRSAFPEPSHAYASAGTYSVTVWVNDSAGGSAHATSSVTVGPASPGGPGGPGSSGSSAGLSAPPTWFWIGIGALVAVAAIGLILLRRRARR